MIDDELYRETFSKLRASEQAKREVLMNIQEKKTKRRLRSEERRVGKEC